MDYFSFFSVNLTEFQDVSERVIDRFWQTRTVGLLSSSGEKEGKGKKKDGNVL